MSDLLDVKPLAELAERLLAAARKAGADAADVIAVRGVSQSVQVREGKVEDSERSEGDDVGLRVLVGKRQAVVSTNDTRRPDVDELAARAVAMARLAPEDAHAGLADSSQLATSFPDLDSLDPVQPSVARLEEIARVAEAAGLAVAGVTKSAGASASSGLGAVVLMTSHGFFGSNIGSSHSVSMTAVAGAGTGMERDYDYSSVVHAADLEDPAKVGRRAGERAIARLNPRKVETCKVPVIYDPRPAAGLVGHLVSAINGTSIARKSSFLTGKLGEQLFASGIRIIEDPLRRRGLRSHAFDAEGVATQRRALIDDGVLQTYLLDCATARALGMTTTGNASRGASSTPSPSATNVHLEPGNLSAKELYADIKAGLYITDMIGSGVNGVTGDYSRGASGFWIENGELAYPVSEITVSGNLIEMFRSLVAANDLEFRTSMNAPTLRVEGLTIAGR